ncbi:hypothetical protein BJ508DRAFT_313531 [Ascobolus immersus RN42]|uniref:Uncharacterized protein n=1 Tax=Ascobolus immersus RN42 TaxID=1160509 RepID=A0A3N4HII5_ASCIM|nr:hypothetical protein BJ508DRAFT_313531 [Ascobolus immersus RN42]
MTIALLPPTLLPPSPPPQQQPKDLPCITVEERSVSNLPGATGESTNTTTIASTKAKKRRNRKRKPSTASANSPTAESSSSSRPTIDRASTEGPTMVMGGAEENEFVLVTPISTSQGYDRPSRVEPRTIFNTRFYPHTPSSLPEPLAHGLLAWRDNQITPSPLLGTERFRQWNMRTLEYWKSCVDKERFMTSEGGGWIAPGLPGAAGGVVAGGEADDEAAPAAEMVRRRRQRSYSCPGYQFVGGQVVGRV